MSAAAAMGTAIWTDVALHSSTEADARKRPCVATAMSASESRMKKSPSASAADPIAAISTRRLGTLLQTFRVAAGMRRQAKRQVIGYSSTVEKARGATIA